VVELDEVDEVEEEEVVVDDPVAEGPDVGVEVVVEVDALVALEEVAEVSRTEQS
jgi:hypothetical protein